MKKQLLLGAFLLSSIFCANAQETISHNNNQDSVTEGGSVGCQTGSNSFSRSFVLNDFDITEGFQVTEVEFGLQDYTAGTPIVVALYTTSQAYPGGYPTSLTPLASETVTFTDDGQSLFVMKQVPITANVPAGSELVVEITGAFFIGGNSAGQTAPSYLLALGCGATTPTDVATLGDFDNVNYVINVTGVEGELSVKNPIASQFSIYPNPATDVVNISNADNILVNNVAVVDLNGRTVKSLSFDSVTEAQVNIADLAAGMYLLNVSSDKGMMTKKIVKN